MTFDVSAFRVDGRVAVVTGAAAGTGNAIAALLADAGAEVVLGDLGGDGAVAAAAAITAAGGRATGVRCDVTSDTDIEGLIGVAVSTYGGVDILVNNAGGGGPKPFDMPMADFERAFRLNVFSVFRLTQLAAPHMRARGGGAVVTISSMAGENTNRDMASYSSSKAAVNHLTRNIAFDLGPSGIRVNAIAPGAIRTQALASVLTPEIEQAMLAGTPIGRLGTPQDIAYACLFLCAPCSSWVSGQVLTVSGGGVQELD
ncbi:7-alpha-hydroxysteroid dehydrogenase [Mycolicibacterium chubuense]|uniref:3-oxoacyl-[acyl-carrier-protein] reductase MabA n=1 Tax=Mycolicibacterium chubuense TaxID=1800 RepID=A0A0J6W7P9_MYCCU|nr:7-alpha-hydroxysteroid dehydrogenase [Mycolicibacterium chubuense]KMO77657.1 7-alpha-hydroxysteroid dehydrogenase [Mycolicibacterium chubuense]ORA54289.1 7-alpha-hydroxysteroid dehydrogenase [Mycolicibacterium chubuense]SPX96740.1 short chain dehydrogenase [Mycolicibacterium chubuense]